MKYTKLLLIPILASLISLTGCSNNIDDKKVEFKYGQMMSNDITYVDYQSIKEKFENKETFILTIFASNCGCWTSLRPLLQSYITTNHIEIFAISYNDFDLLARKNNEYFSLKVKSGNTSFAIIDKGEICFNEYNDSKAKMFQSQNEFNKFMEEMISLPKMFYISLDQVDTLFKTEKTSLLYFARSNCSDCQYFNTHFLNEYKPTKNLYILDCESLGIREYDKEGNLTTESAVLWQEFKDNYYLSSKYNEKYGYDEGYVPYLMLLKGNKETKKPEILSASTYLNDTITKTNDTYTITKSFYSNERKQYLDYVNNVSTPILEGMNLSKEDVSEFGDYVVWNKEKASIYHDALIKSFLDESMNKIDHDGFMEE